MAGQHLYLSKEGKYHRVDFWKDDDIERSCRWGFQIIELSKQDRIVVGKYSTRKACLADGLKELKMCDKFHEKAAQP